MFEVTSKEEEAKKEMDYYINCLKALEELSQNANIFCLIHKMDLIPEAKRDETFWKKEESILAVSQKFTHTKCFKTSIWDETLYKAWSDIVHILLPNVEILKSKL